MTSAQIQLQGVAAVVDSHAANGTVVDSVTLPRKMAEAAAEGLPDNWPDGVTWGPNVPSGSDAADSMVRFFRAGVLVGNNFMVGA